MSVLAATIRRSFGTTDETDPQAWWPRSFGMSKTASGERVGPDQALRSSAYYACLRNKAEDLAKLPWFVYRRTADGRERVTDHPAHKLLHDRANPEMGARTWRETMEMWKSGWGNAYSEIETTVGGKPVALWPIHPSRVRPKRDKTTLKLYYEIHPDDGDPNKVYYLWPEEMFHVKNPGNGTVGYSIAELAAETLGITLAAQKFGASFFGNGAHPGTILIHPKTLSDAARAKLHQEWELAHKGANLAHKTAVLYEDIKVEKFGIPPNDAQFIETRQFEVEEICRWSRMPPHKVQHLSRSTFSNITEQNIEYASDSIHPTATRFEEEANIKLLSDAERQDMYTEIDLNGLMRGDPAKRAMYYRTMWNFGAMNHNEVRSRENMNSIPNGDVHFVPANMATLDNVIAGNVGGKGPGSDQSGEQDKGNGKGDTAEAVILPILTEALERVKAKETKAVNQKQSKLDADDFTAWEENFKTEQAAYARSAIAPAVTAYLQLHKIYGLKVHEVNKSATALAGEFYKESPVIAANAMIQEWEAICSTT